MKRVLSLTLIILIVGCGIKDKENYIMSEGNTVKYIEMKVVEINGEEFGLYKLTDPNPNDDIGFAFKDIELQYFSDKENRLRGYRLVNLGHAGEYQIRHNGEFYYGFDLIAEGTLTVEDYKKIGYPFVSYKNEELEPPVTGVEKIPDYMDFISVKTMDINGEKIELLRAQPKENEIMVCYNFDFASVEFFDGVYETGCMNEYKVKYTNFEYHGWVSYNLGYMTIEELHTLGFPIEETG